MGDEKVPELLKYFKARWETKVFSRLVHGSMFHFFHFVINFKRDCLLLGEEREIPSPKELLS